MIPTEVITSMSAAIGLAKELVGINKAVDEATWKLKTAELTSALADAKNGSYRAPTASISHSPLWKRMEDPHAALSAKQITTVSLDITTGNSAAKNSPRQVAIAA